MIQPKFQIISHTMKTMVDIELKKFNLICSKRSETNKNPFFICSCQICKKGQKLP